MDPLSAGAARNFEVPGTLRGLEASFFRSLNGVLDPLVRAGCFSPGCVGGGVILLETRGRKSGKTHSTPLLAYAIGDLVVVSTVRSRRSEWVRNIFANRQVRYWMGGRLHHAIALAIAPRAEPSTPPPDEIDAPARLIASALFPLARDTGLTFAVLAPGNSR